jgi:putative (di)nucleoside polyphosphate hydrolase
MELLPDESVEQLIQQAQTEKLYRPVVSCVVVDAEGKMLFTLSSKAAQDKNWNYPQGGIEENEDIIAAVYRELNEELGINPKDLQIQKYCGYNDVDSPPGRKLNGYKKGKRYFWVLIKYNGPTELTPDQKEIINYTWVLPEQTSEYINTIRKERRDLVTQVLKLMDLPPESTRP